MQLMIEVCTACYSKTICCFCTMLFSKIMYILLLRAVAHSRGGGVVEVVYNLPESIRKAGLSTIAIELPQDSAVALWEASGQKGSEERVKDVRKNMFMKKLNEHIHKHFHLKLEVKHSYESCVLILLCCVYIQL